MDLDEITTRWMVSMSEYKGDCLALVEVSTLLSVILAETIFMRIIKTSLMT